MTEPLKKRKTDFKHIMYGGMIDIEDFNTSSPNKRRLRNQADAMDFQAELDRKRRLKKELEPYKDMTLEQLREQKIISNTDGRPSSSLTDEKWQKELILRKMFVIPYRDGSSKKLTGPYAKEFGGRNEQTQRVYDGCTNWQSYCSYINDVLENIRAGQVDYCYYIYQILDLLKFHYDDLQTKYCDGYWNIWLTAR